MFFHVIAKFFTIAIEELIALGFLIKVNLGASGLGADFLFVSCELGVIVVVVVGVLVGVVGGRGVGDLVGVVDFDVDAFGVALDLLLSAFPGCNNDFRLVVTGFEAFREFHINIFFKRVILLDEDRLIEAELLVAE